MNEEKLKEILESHKLWLEGNPQGEVANLERANLKGANLKGAILEEANLRGAILWGATLRRATLRGAILEEANLRGADLREAIFWGATLERANLWGADLRRANLEGATLKGATLEEANLWGANLGGADLQGVKIDRHTIGIHPAPEGELIGWGKKRNKIDGKPYIVKLLIPKEAKRSCATTRKFRAEYAICLEVEGAEKIIVKNEWGEAIYEPGKKVVPHEWCEDRWQECAGGIHFFLTREEALAWDLL